MNHVLLLDQNSFSLLTDPGKSWKQDLKGQKEYKSCNYIQYTCYTQHTNQFNFNISRQCREKCNGIRIFKAILIGYKLYLYT